MEHKASVHGFLFYLVSFLQPEQCIWGESIGVLFLFLFHLGNSPFRNFVEIFMQQESEGLHATMIAQKSRFNLINCFFGMFLVGGIYTVIRSKAPAAVDVLGNKYCLIGIYNDLQCKTEVEMMEPEDPAMKGAVQAMRDSGVEV